MRPDERTPILEPRQGAPFLFELARGMERKHVRGSTRLIGLLGALGMLDRPALLAISDSLQIEFPLARTPWDQRDLDNYEIEYIASFAALAQKLPSPVTFIDVGADIGIFALKIYSLPAFSVSAFTPNAARLSASTTSRKCSRRCSTA